MTHTPHISRVLCAHSSLVPKLGLQVKNLMALRRQSFRTRTGSLNQSQFESLKEQLLQLTANDWEEILKGAKHITYNEDEVVRHLLLYLLKH